MTYNKSMFLSFLLCWLPMGCFNGSYGGGAEGDEDPTRRDRDAMVRRQIEARGVKDPAVLEAMRSVPRHLFVPASVRDHAYADHPLPIGFQQTISQPYIVALMTELAAPRADHRVLEIGTGSGYQAAILAKIVAEVYSIEIVEPLARQAQQTLQALQFDNVQVKAGDGYLGWPDQAPFDSIIVTAAPPRIPQPLLDQLKVGGRMVIPVGESYQELLVITRTETGFQQRKTIPVRFVPMTGPGIQGTGP